MIKHLVNVIDNVTDYVELSVAVIIAGKVDFWDSEGDQADELFIKKVLSSENSQDDWVGHSVNVDLGRKLQILIINKV